MCTTDVHSSRGCNGPIRTYSNQPASCADALDHGGSGHKARLRASILNDSEEVTSKSLIFHCRSRVWTQPRKTLLTLLDKASQNRGTP